MRREDNLGHLPQRMVGRQRLDLENVQAGTSDFTRLQGRRQIGQIDNDATTDIDQISRAFHPLQPCPIDEFERLRRMRRGHHDKIAFLQQIVEPVGPPQGDSRRCGGCHRINAQNPHAKRQAAARVSAPMPPNPMTPNTQSASVKASRSEGSTSPGPP